MTFLYGKGPDGKLLIGITFEELDSIRQNYVKLHMPIDEKLAINEFVATIYKLAEVQLVDHLTKGKSNAELG